MSERWVLNASPIIVLAHAEHEHLFFALADEVVIPRPVAIEIEAGPESDPARRFLAAFRLPIVDISSPPAELLAWDLGAGETAVFKNHWRHPALGQASDKRTYSAISSTLLTKAS